MLSQLLIAASLLYAGYKDSKERMVADLVWVPAAVGVVLGLALDPSAALLTIVRIAVIGAIVFVAARFGVVGEADSIAFVLVTADPWALAPFFVLMSAGVVALSHIGFLFATGMVGGSKTIPLSQFKAESRWIPKAVIVGGVRQDVDANVNRSRDVVEAMDQSEVSVEVQYGVPTVTYLAAGYIAYLVYLALFNPALLATLP